MATTLADINIAMVNRPRHPGNDASDEALMKFGRDIHDYARAETSLRILRKKAAAASFARLVRERAAFNDVPSDIDDPRKLATAARRVIREADRLAARDGLRAFERVLVERGLAEWLPGCDPEADQ